MHKLFVSPSDIDGNYITVTGDDVEHLHAIRIKEGETIFASDGVHTVYCAVLSQMRKNSAIFEITEEKPFENEPEIDITVCCALLKGGANEDVIKQSVELGASKIVLFSSENCVAKEREKDGKYYKTARQAAMQCGRDRIPQIVTGINFAQTLSLLENSDLPLLFHEKARKPFFDVVRENKNPRSAAFAVGPEGGFTENEVALAANRGIPAVSMGKRILRAVTAPLCALSVLISVYDAGR